MSCLLLDMMQSLGSKVLKTVNCLDTSENARQRTGEAMCASTLNRVLPVNLALR